MGLIPVYYTTTKMSRKKRLEKVIAVKRVALQAVQEKIEREVANEKK